MKALIFPGQGCQKEGMGKDLYEKFPVAKELFEKEKISGDDFEKLMKGELVYEKTVKAEEKTEDFTSENLTVVSE